MMGNLRLFSREDVAISPGPFVTHARWCISGVVRVRSCRVATDQHMGLHKEITKYQITGRPDLLVVPIGLQIGHECNASDKTRVLRKKMFN